MDGRATFHDLRHSNVTMLIENGAPIHVVSERVGHSDVTTTMRIYAHVLPAMDQKAAQTTDEGFRRALGG